MNFAWPSRRGFLFGLGATATAASAPQKKPNTSPSELKRLRDPATEFEVLRLTDPAKASAILPAPPNRAATRGGGLIYCSDRSGSMQVWRMDVKNGTSQQLTSAEALQPASVTLLPDDRTLVYIDGHQIVSFGRRVQPVYTIESDWQFGAHFAVADDGGLAAVSESREGRFRLRSMNLRRPGSAATLFEAAEPLRFVRIRPKHPAILYNHSGELTLVSPDGRDSKRLKVQGSAGFALWTPDGRAIHYVTISEPGRGSVQLREHIPDTGEDKLIANTTQFVTFDRNADASVFVGASGSKASPYVLLLVRSGRREMTLAEHKASTPQSVAVAFSSNSQRLFYNTDREGRPAIYSIPLEKFVEDTDNAEPALR